MFVKENTDLDKDLYLLKNKVVNYTLVVVSSIVIITQSFIVYRDISFGSIGAAFYIQNIAVIYFLVITIFRKKIGLTLKVTSIALVIFFVFVTGMYKYGFLASGKIYVVVGPLFLSFLMNRKKSTYLLTVLIITYLTLGYLFTSGVLKYPGNEITFVSEYVSEYYIWFTEALTIFFVSYGLLFVGSKFDEALRRNYRQIKNQNLELEKHQEELEDKITERTKELAESNRALQNTIIKLKDTQAQLIQSEKMASLGILTSGITHEINNPLNYIMGGVQGLEVISEGVRTEDREDFDTLISTIKTGVEKTSTIVNSLDKYNRNDSYEDEQINVHNVIEKALQTLKYQYEGRIEVKKNFGAASHTVVGNEGEILQVILNILLNAIQAIHEKGNIEITTENVDSALEITIRDNGTGISKENLKHIFDPFFTTKDPGKGTGLGLAITYKLINRLNGSITVESKLEAGTVVKIKLINHGE